MNRRTMLLSFMGVLGLGAAVRSSGFRFALDRSLASGTGAKAPSGIRRSGERGFKAVNLLQIPLGGGGFVTGLDISADGKRFACRTDVSNAYIRDDQDLAWRPLFSPKTMRASDYNPLPETNGKADGHGVAGIRIAPSNKNVIVASHRGYVWLSTDGGRSIRRTALRQSSMPSNSGLQRLYNRTIDIHPSDERRFIIGTHGDGVWHTADSGENWSRAKLPSAGKSLDGLAGLNLVLFDPYRPQRVYAFVTGSGLYRSEQGPEGTFSRLSGGPTVCSSMVAGPTGELYLCEQSKTETGQVWRYGPDAGWAASASEVEAMVLAVDPLRQGRLIACNPNGSMVMSEDAGESWKVVGGAKWRAGAGEVAWTRGLTTMFPAEIVFDPNVPNQLWVAQGVGVAKTGVPPKDYELEDWSSGIEELCLVAAVSPPGGPVVVSALDKPFWRLETDASYSNDFRYPATPGNPHDPNLVSFSSYLDYAGDDPSFLVGVVPPTARSAPGYSIDGGKAWRAFEGSPATGWGYGGCIAASTKNNIILLPSNNGVGVYTKDGGKSWSAIMLDGSTATGGFSNAYYVARKNLSADKTRPGYFALIYTVIKNDAYEEPLGGVWVTRDGGQTWTQVFRGVVSSGSRDPKLLQAKGIDPRQFWQCQLEYVPGRSGELVYTPHSDFSNDPLYWSKDDGRSWGEIHPSVRNVSAFGFGKATVDGARPSVYFWGEVDGMRGLHASFDWFQSEPRLVTSTPSQMLAEVSFVSGNPNVFGQVFVGTSCAGVVRVDLEM